MATYLKLISFEPATSGLLRPAPGLAYYKKLTAALEDDTTPEFTHPASILQHSLKVLCDYKGTMLTLQGNVHVFRTNPNSPQFPPPGATEACRITIGDKEYVAQIMFVEEPKTVEDASPAYKELQCRLDADLFTETALPTKLCEMRELRDHTL
jgi:hypothetical protein